MRVRRGSAADKFIRLMNWMDNSTPGKAIGCLATGLFIVGLFAYGMYIYPV